MRENDWCTFVTIHHGFLEPFLLRGPADFPRFASYALGYLYLTFTIYQLAVVITS